MKPHYIIINKLYFLKNSSGAIDPSPYRVIIINDFGIKVKHCSTGVITHMTKSEFVERSTWDQDS